MQGKQDFSYTLDLAIGSDEQANGSRCIGIRY